MTSAHPLINQHTSLLTASGRPVVLGKLVNRGGEGTVYEIQNNNGFVAKIFNHAMTTERLAKIKYMISKNNNNLNNITAWPTAIIFEKQTMTPVGFMMRYFKSRSDIHKLYSPKSRSSYFARVDWRFLVRVAANVSRAFTAVHATSAVIGDVNHGSVLVGADATVVLIDCDSFQMSDGQQIFRCDVGVDVFTPPELQFKSFKDQVRTFNHDNFCLAVLIFLLLMMGRHPFSGIFTGPGDLPLTQAIAESKFVYGKHAARFSMQRPPGTVDLSILGSTLSNLFERAFDRDAPKNGRPTPSEWVNALVQLEKSLVICRKEAGHRHIKGVSCPWCILEKHTNTSYFAKIGPPNNIFPIELLNNRKLYATLFLLLLSCGLVWYYYGQKSKISDFESTNIVPPSRTDNLEATARSPQDRTGKLKSDNCVREKQKLDNKWGQIKNLDITTGNCKSLKSIESQIRKTVELAAKCPDLDLRYSKPLVIGPLLWSIAQRMESLCKISPTKIQ